MALVRESQLDFPAGCFWSPHHDLPFDLNLPCSFLTRHRTAPRLLEPSRPWMVERGRAGRSPVPNMWPVPYRLEGFISKTQVHCLSAHFLSPSLFPPFLTDEHNALRFLNTHVSLGISKAEFAHSTLWHTLFLLMHTAFKMSYTHQAHCSTTLCKTYSFCHSPLYFPWHGISYHSLQP